MICRFVVLVSLWGLSLVSSAQDISGFVKDEQQKAVAGVSVVMKKVRSGAVVKFAITDSTGRYTLLNTSPGNFMMHISHVGYLPARSDTVTVQAEQPGMVTVADIILSKAAQELKEVRVTSTPPVIEMRHGKIIMNVESSLNSIGQNALEVLAKSPGVMVTKDEMINVSGKTGVTVYINGKALHLGGKDLAEYLKTIQSSMVQNIEIILNPSARYDAAGNGGIINIRLKKNDMVGMNGTVNAGYNIATYARTNGNLNLNYRNKSLNIYGGYGFRHTINESFQDLQRELLDTLFDQRSRTKALSRSITHRTGIDYYINSRHTVGIMMDGVFADNRADLSSNTPISYIPSKQITKTLVANNASAGDRISYNVNGNYRFAGAKGQELVVDANYGRFDIAGGQYQPNFFYDQAGSLQDSRIYKVFTGNNIRIGNIRGDYEQNAMKGTLEIGFKSSFVTSDNDFRSIDVYGTDEVLDTARSNRFNYEENINAVYGSYSRTFKTWSYQVGLRLENTNSRGDLTGYRWDGNRFAPFDTVFTRHYTNPFPSFAITYNKNPTRQFSLSYSRRIDRPAYQIINPFESRLDEYSYYKGNPNIRPQYTHSVALTFMYKFKLVAILNHSYVTDMFTQLTDTTDRSKIFLTYQNLTRQRVTSLSVNYNLKYKKYSLVTNFNGYYSLYNTYFGPGKVIDMNAFVYRIFLQQGFQWSKTWYTQFTTLYNSPSISQGTYRNKKTWSVDFGVQKTILNGRGTLRAAINDIFYTQQWKSHSYFVGQTVRASGRSESRQLLLHFFLRFGNSKIKAAKERKDTQDESKRVRVD